MVSPKLISAPLITLATMRACANAASDCCKNVTSPAFHQAFISKWHAFWNGDLSVLNEIAKPDMVMHTDRIPFPSGNGSLIVPVTSREGLLQGLQIAFAPYEKYGFDFLAWAGTDNRIAVRWTMNAVLGENATGSAKPGETVTMNGTDFVFLDKCSGLIEQYDLAKDNLQRHRNPGLASISL